LQPKEAATAAHRSAGDLVRADQLLEAEVAAFWNRFESFHENRLLSLLSKCTQGKGY
jgi:hypothetical protein